MQLPVFFTILRCAPKSAKKIGTTLHNSLDVAEVHTLDVDKIFDETFCLRSIFTVPFRLEILVRPFVNYVITLTYLFIRFM